MTRDWNDQTRGELLISNRLTSERQTRIDMVNRLLAKKVPLDDALFIGDPDGILTELDKQSFKV